MPAKHELRKYDGDEKVWVGKYRNSHNLLHWHYDCELIYVERGSIDVFCSGKNYLLAPGDAMLIQSGEIHYMKAREETYLLVFIFDDSLMKTIVKNERLASPRLSDPSTIPEAYARIRGELKSDKPFRAQAANALTQLLLTRLLRSEKLVPATSAEAGLKTLKKLLDDVEEKYCEYTFERAAEFAGFSEAYFSRLFHKQMGMTFSQYLNNVRIRHAVDIMRGEPKASMTELSIKTGYTTIRNFNRMFRAITGYAPRELPDDFRFEDRYGEGEDSDPTLEGCTLVE